MTFAQVIDNKIVTVSGRIPSAARRLDTRGWVANLPDASPADQRACGWFQVTDVTRPADTGTVTHDRTIGMVEGAPTVVWTAREFTADEVAARTADTNDATIRTAAARALAVNRDFLADGDVTNAKVVAQVRALTRQNVALIRLQLSDLSGTD